MRVLRSRSLTVGASVALAAAGLVVPAVSAAAAPALTVTPTMPTAGSSFTVSATGLTAGAKYRLVVATGGASDRVDVSESNSCRAEVAADTDGKLSCTVTESTKGTYAVNLVDPSSNLVQSANVSFSAPVADLVAPKLADLAGANNDKVTVYKNAAIESYSVQGTAVPFGANDTYKDVTITPQAAADTTDVTIVAKAAAGYLFANGTDTMMWTLRTTAADPVPPALSPTAPTVSDPAGTGSDTLTFAQVENASWKLDGQSVTFGTGNTTVAVPITGTRDTAGKVTVTATLTADANHRFSDGSTVRTFTYEFTNVKGEPSVERTEGSTRFDTAVEIAKKYFPGQRETVYVANGMNFPDALAGGPAAAQANAPLLLTARGSIQQNVLDEIARMQPKNIRVVGGANVVSKEVEASLAKIAPVLRVEGADRFATAAKVSSSRASTGGVVYLASGMNFADALSGGSGAARENAPLLLTNGSSLSDETVVELRRLKPSKVVVVGGESVVKTSVVRQVGDVVPGVTIDRAAGKNRFETSAMIIENVTGKSWTSDAALPTRAFLATGLNYPDALAGIPAAFVSKAPLALTMPSCLPPAVKAELDRLPLTSTVRLGSSNVVGDFSVMSGACS